MITAVDVSEWAIPLNTLLLIVLAVYNARTNKRAARANAQLREDVTRVRQVAKESHNTLIEQLAEDRADRITGMFPTESGSGAFAEDKPVKPAQRENDKVGD